jgi:hypothetical protein
MTASKRILAGETAPPKPKKSQKRAAGQKEMLLPIPGTKDAPATKKTKPASRTRKAG